ncbi:hypothetical protein FAUST_4028 [Fusarium austroamericanum]|uniref:Uncharacterized protein n=1 Tax=Fusarium austroamericanum TaxID=282268 RepID=A0AAN6C3P4_FUSAU|nr:hypothetical protein FAUST_4028 [Fusarium austroamericanum]
MASITKIESESTDIGQWSLETVKGLGQSPEPGVAEIYCGTVYDGPCEEDTIIPSVFRGDFSWTLHVCSDDGCWTFDPSYEPMNLGSTKLELYVLQCKLPNLFESNGVWSVPILLARMFLGAHCKQAVQSRSAWVSLVTRICHGSAAPFTGETQDTKKHWLKYNTYDGSPSFGTDFDGGKFKLNHWLVAYRNWKTLPEKPITCVNCYDQAAIVEVALSLGMDYNQVAWEYHQVFGFISSKAVLVGWGECNNPYVCNDLSRQIVHPDNDPSRQGFRNHAYLSWGPDFHPEKETDFYGQNRDPEKWNGAPVFIIDACAGPHVGDETRDQYNNTLDSNRDDPKKYPVDIFKQLVAKNKRCSKWTSGVTGLLTRGNDWSLGEVQNEIYPGSPIEWSALDLPAASQQLTMVFGGKISQVQANFTKIISKVKFDKPYAPDDLFSAPIPNEKDQFSNIITEEKVYKKSDISISYFSLMIHFTPSYEKAIELIKYRTTQYSISDTHPTLMEQKSTSNIIMIGGKYLKLFVFANLVVELSCLDGTAYLQSIADQVAEYFEASKGDLVAPAQWESCLN